MKHWILLSFFIPLTAIQLSGQPTADAPNSGLQVSYNKSANEINVDWWAKSSVFYFVLETNDLVSDPWAYFPYAVLGTDGVEGIAFTANSNKMFLRVTGTRDVNSPLLLLDQDGDKVSTVNELLEGTDPFLSLSLDGDTIPDDWERFYGLDVSAGVDSSTLDAEGDGLTNASEFSLGTKPNDRDNPNLSFKIF